MSTEIATISQPENAMQSYCFSNAQAFEAAQRMATALSKATLIPSTYQNNLPNCIIALEVAQRMGASPLMVMQNLYIVHGKPGWSAQFVISAINTCGRFRPLQFELVGKEGGEDRGCIAWTTEKTTPLPRQEDVQAVIEKHYSKTKEVLSQFQAYKNMGIPLLESPKVSIDMAKKEGWFQKSGSKWQTIPELMLRYRSSSFFGKLYAPEILMGMQTAEEIEDIIPIKDVTPRNTDLQAAVMGNPILQAEEVKEEKANPLADIIKSSDNKKSAESIDLSFPGGEIKNFPGDIETIGLNTFLMELQQNELMEFVKINRQELEVVAKLMEADDKKAAAHYITKLIKEAIA